MIAERGLFAGDSPVLHARGHDSGHEGP